MKKTILSLGLLLSGSLAFSGIQIKSEFTDRNNETQQITFEGVSTQWQTYTLGRSDGTCYEVKARFKEISSENGTLKIEIALLSPDGERAVVAKSILVVRWNEQAVIVVDGPENPTTITITAQPHEALQIDTEEGSN